MSVRRRQIKSRMERDSRLQAGSAAFSAALDRGLQIAKELAPLSREERTQRLGVMLSMDSEAIRRAPR